MVHGIQSEAACAQRPPPRDPPRALIAAPSADPRIGGLERFSHELATVLRSDGWVVDFAFSGYSAPRWVRRVGLRYAYQSRVARRNVHFQPDLAIGNGFLSAPAASRRIHVFHGTMVGHSIAIRADAPRRETLRCVVAGGLTERWSARGARVVAVSDRAGAEVRRFYRLKVDAVIPNAVDVKLFRPRPRDESRAALGLATDFRMLLYVGRMETGKGAHMLRSVAAEAGYELAVAGHDPAGVGVHLGPLAHNELALAYNAADAVLLPTRYEGCSYVVLEALASAVPLMTTDAGWMRSFVERVPAYASLLAEPNVSSIAQRLRTLETCDPTSITEQAKEYVCRHHSLQAWSTTWLDLIRDVMAES